MVRIVMSLLFLSAAWLHSAAAVCPSEESSLVKEGRAAVGWPGKPAFKAPSSWVPSGIGGVECRR